MADHRPSRVAHERASGWYGRRSVSYCDELRSQRDDCVETRMRVLIGMVVVLGIGVAVLFTGRTAMATWLGFGPAVLLAVIGGGNQLMIRYVDRKIAESCSDAPERRDLSDPRAIPPRPD